MLMQRLWSAGLGWDENVPAAVLTDWSTYKQSLIFLDSISIPRHVCCNNYTSIQLHGFSDASTLAYGACIYIRCTDQFGNKSTKILCAKGKVAPLKTLTVPKLELCGAVLLARLYEKVIKSLNLSFSSCVFWSDSMVTLSWLQTCPSKLRTFVSNRVAKIQSITDGNLWRYVPTGENPADLITRGSDILQLQSNLLWWNGPQWLNSNEDEWPVKKIEVRDEELRPQSSSFVVVNTDPNFINIERFSTMNKLLNTMLYVLRFINIARKLTKNRGCFTVEERKEALLALIRKEQNISFSSEIQALKKGKPINSKSPLLSLAPFLDDAGIIRVGGRLKFSELSFDEKHQILLPRSNHLTDLIAKHEHLKLLHAGPSAVLYSLRTRFWPIAGRALSRRVVRSCIKCFRANPSNYILHPQMGQLPESRVIPKPPFYHTGVDYAGPVKLKSMKGRGGKLFKGYIALFVCFCTKAIHLELVTDLSTDAFMSALRRFVSRRGRPCVMHSDNATNFTGANRELRDLIMYLKSDSNSIRTAAAAEDIDWQFIPAYSPHFGGLWEAGVKSAKHHLRRVIGDQALTFEEYYTLLVQIEAILNSRPITQMSCDPNDISALTPAHLLLGRPLTAIPDRDYTNQNFLRLSRYQQHQSMVQSFWKVWSREYLNNLQQRTKWTKAKGPDVKKLVVDDLVLLVNDALPVAQWKLGRVIELHPGNDGATRVVSIRTTNGIVKRAVQRICPLPKFTSDEEAA